jgi:hypothetical protein
MTLRTPMIGAPDISDTGHTGFLLAEDAALHKYLSGITVPTRPGSNEVTEVGVWFRYPQSERNKKFPFITIDMVDVKPAYDLWTSQHYVDPTGMYSPSVSPGLPAPDANKNLVLTPYLAFRIAYQITVHCRSTLHDRYLNSLFMTDILPPRPFWIGVDADNTWRRCEFIDFAQSDSLETPESGDKRLFRKMYTVTVQAEVPQEPLRQGLIPQAWQVLRVFMPVTDRNYVEEYFNTVLNPDGEAELTPVETFSDEERAAHGEMFYLYTYPET